MAEVAEVQIKNSAREQQEVPSSFRSGPEFFERFRSKRLLLGIALAAVLAALGVWRTFAVRESTDDAEIDGHIVPISARVGGTVVTVNVNDNQFVEAGAVLAQVDPKDYQTALDKAKADLAEAEAQVMAAQAELPITSTTTGSQLSSAQADVESAQAGLAAAQKEVDAAKARLRATQARLDEARANETKANNDLERMKQLIAKDEISQQQFDAAVAAANGATAAVASAQATVAEAEEGVKVAEVRLIQAHAGLSQAQAAARSAGTAPQKVREARARLASALARKAQRKAVLDQAELNLQYTTVRAPVSGVVSKKTVQVGQNVEAGQPLLAIVPLEDVWVTANFKETQMKNMRPGQRALISVDALGGQKFRGHVDSIAAATGEKFSVLPPENATGNYVKVVQRVPVKIVFEPGQDPQHLLRPGMSAEPTVLTR
jgi:membrane fusion protein, multidrug efflux system